MPRVLLGQDGSGAKQTDTCLLAFRESELLSLFGRFHLEVLVGSLQCCGATLVPGYRDVVMAPSINSAVTVSSSPASLHSRDDMVFDDEALAAVDARLPGACREINVVAVVRLNSIDTKFNLSASTFGGNAGSGSDDSARTQIIRGVHATKDGCVESTPDAWFQLVPEISAVQPEDDMPPIILVCGRRDTGKSFFCRFLLNCLVSSGDYQSVTYVDTDLGQPMLTAPTLVSLHSIDRPILGSFQERQPQVAVMCAGCSPESDPNHYINAVKYLLAPYLHRRKTPVVINTHGWITGLGLEIFTELAKYIRPRYVVHLYNDPGADDVASACPPQTILVPLPSVERTAAPMKMKNSRRRDIRLSFHLKTEFDVKLASMSQYCVPLVNLCMFLPAGVPASSSDAGAVFNGRIVGLLQCEVPPGGIVQYQLPVCQCVGFGIVRAIDPATKILYLSAPQSSDVIAHVNAIALSGLRIPPALLSAGAPYTSISTGAGVGSAPMKAKVVLRHSKRQ